MTMISFEVAPTFATSLINQGVHTGKIISVEIVTNVRPHNETQFCVTWMVGNNTFMDKFKLWANEENKRNYAQQKLNNLCKALGIQIPYQKAGGKVNFDTSVLVGKQAKVAINQFETSKGEKLPYIKSYETVVIAESEDEMSFNQEIPFN